MMKHRLSLLFTVLLCLTTGLTSTARASHLRGTSVSWQPTGTPGQIQFNIQYSQRTSFGCTVGGTAGTCTLGGGVDIPFNFGDGSAAVTVTATITSLNTAQDFLSAEGTITHTYSGAGPFTAFYENSARVDTIKSGGNQNLRMETLVSPNPGPVSPSPVVSMPAFVTVPLQNTTGFQVFAANPDGDTLNFRLSTSKEMYANNSFSCAAQQPPGLSINNSGLVTWDTTQINNRANNSCGFQAPAAGDLWTVQFMVEDVDSSNNVKSKVPLDIIIEFISSTESAPTFTFSNPGPIVAKPGVPLSLSLSTADSTPNSRVTITVAGLPVGATSTNLNQTLTPPVGSTFNWTPTVAQVGTYVVTYAVTDDTFQQTLASVTITVPQLYPPVASCSAPLIALYDTPISIPVQVSDPQNDALTVVWSTDGTPVHTDNVPASNSTTNLSLSQTFTTLGSHSVSINATDTDTLSAGCSTAVTVNAANQTISFPAPTGVTFGSPDVMLTATATSGLPVAFTASGNCTIVNGAVHATAVGSCSITASQAGSNNYNAAPPVTQTFTIAPAQVDVINFPPTAVGTSSNVQDIQVTLPAAGTLNGITIPQSQGGKQEYSIGAITGCTVGANNVAGTICTIPVTFTPAYPGQRWVPLQVNISSGSLNVGLMGTGLGPQVALTPGIISTVAGNGSQSPLGNGGPAVKAGFSGPYDVALDRAGNFYIADREDHEIRKVNAATGLITAVAGNGSVGFSGDGGPATNAQLAEPHAVAIDAAGNLYIADASNFRIREVSASTGIITTIAGNGTQGFSGDGGLATAAELGQPTGIAVDAVGNVYLSDNQRIRKITAATGIITTIAGNGGNNASIGDGGPATSAELFSPEELALDGQGDIFVADVNDNRIREVNATTGIITTVAGNGSMNFSGDGGLAVNAGMQPFGIAVDSAGNLYIGDSFNFRIRKVDAATGIIHTVAGNGNYANSGDGGSATSAAFESTVGVALDSLGNIYFADLYSGRIREVDVSQAALVYPTATNVGSADATDDPQSAIVANIGNAALTITPPNAGSNPNVASGFALNNASTCPAVSSTNAASTLGSGTSCTYALNFTPTTAGTYTGTAVLTDNSLNVAGSMQTIQLSGTGIAAATTSTLTSSHNPSPYGQPVTVTATIAAPAGTGTPAGTVQFSVGGTPVGGPVTLNSNGSAIFTSSSFAVGANSITAVFTPAATNFTASTAPAFSQTVVKATPGANGVPAVTVSSGPSPSTFGQPVTATATVPSGATGIVTFMQGSTVLGTGTISGGTATLTTTTLSFGTDPITAVYSGDNNFNTATSAADNQVVNKASPTLAAPVISPANSPYGTSVTITQAVTAGETGTVTFHNGSTVLGTGTIANGVATLTTTALPAGVDSVTTQTSGDANFNSATSPAVSDNVSKAAGTLAAPTVTPANSPFGTSVTISQAVPAVETGTVTFYYGSTVLGAGTITNGVATLVTTALPAGPDSITGQTSGDSNFNAATSPVTLDTVTKAAGTLGAPTLSPANSPYGTSVTITQAVPVGETGTVTFYSGSSVLGTGTIANGVATLTTRALPAGTDSITTQTSGDANHSAATSPAVTDNVGKATGALAAPVVSPLNASYGTSVTITQTVPAGETGTVTFYNGSTVLGAGTIVNGVATLTTSALPAGTDSITTQTSGDANFAAATSPAVSDNVGRAGTGLAAPVISPANSPFGTSVTITQAVPAGETGTVTFYSGTTVLGRGTIANGVASFTTTALPAGTDAVSAQTSGDANFSPLTSPVVSDNVSKAAGSLSAPTVSPLNSPYGTSVTITQAVPAGETGTVTFYSGTTVLGTGTIANGIATLNTTALTAGTDSITTKTSGDASFSAATSPAVPDNVGKAAGTLAAPTVSPMNAPYGTAVTITQAVPAGETGTVTFYSGTTVLGTGIIANGVASLTTTALPAGANSITAQTSGDANFGGATSPAVLDNVGKATSTLAPLTVSPLNAPFGTSVTLTQAVPMGEIGTVTFYNGGTPIGTATIVNGVATLTTSALPAGTLSLTGLTSGDGNHSPATSPAVPDTVGKAAAALAAPSISPLNAPYGTSVTITQAVPAGETGTVTFYNGSAVLGTLTITNGVATLTTSALPAGMDAITAQTSGDASFAAATSAPASDSVSKLTPALAAMTVSAMNAPYGTPVTLTQAVPAGETGTVTFYNGSTVLGTATIKNGVATLTTSALPAGADSLTVQAGGDANYNAATSAPVPDTVGAAPVQVTLSTSATSINPNQTVTFTATLSSPSGTPSGTVQFYDGSTLLGTGPLTAGVATFTATLPAGSTNVITAQYPGTLVSAASQASFITVVVGPLDFGYTLASSSTSTQTVTPGAAAAYNLTVTPLYGGFPGVVNFTVAGLPPGATYSLSPSTLPASSTGSAQMLTVQTSATVAKSSELQIGSKLAPAMLALLVLPFAGSRRMRKSGDRIVRYGLFCLLVVLGAGAMAGLTGCGAGNGVYHEGPQAYTLTVTATSASISHSVTVTLNEQ